MTKKYEGTQDAFKELLDDPALDDYRHEEQTFKVAKYPVWTKNKSLLVATYLRHFIFVTWRGVYLDGFAGPQYGEHESEWSAKKVLELQRPFAEKRYGLDRFFLCDNDKSQIEKLNQLKEEFGDSFKEINIITGDFNERVDDILMHETFAKSTAVFCLLDQQSTECHWQTIQKLSALSRKSEYKIELFYFLASGWLHRSIEASTTPDGQKRITNWWGDGNWDQLKGSSKYQLVELVREKFRSLGYKYVIPWQIYSGDKGAGQVLYHMIHASDHPAASSLMERAYHKVLEIQHMRPDQQIDFLNQIKGIDYSKSFEQ